MHNPLKIVMVAGEHSGDILGAGLLKAIQIKQPNAEFIGIGGPRMIELGFRSLYTMDKLSVFGLFEVLKHLPGLLKIRRDLRKTITDLQPDVFIGIDAPDFNLKLERDLHALGIKTVHYVSPTVWAWRPKRIKKLQGTLDALLCIFPFEENYFKDKNVPAFFIGHPLADKLAAKDLLTDSKVTLNIKGDDTVLALMPGSRTSELKHHALLFLQTAELCAKEIPNLKVLVPMPDVRRQEEFNEIYKGSDIQLNLLVKTAPSEQIIFASDMVLTASGTATLEVMLLNKPMVVAYKLSTLTAWVISTFSMLKIPFVSMPNLIAGKEVVPEFLQENAKADVLAKSLLNIHTNQHIKENMLDEFTKMKGLLKLGADEQAAKVVIKTIDSSQVIN
ncbi:MAG: lipid-A-disaccharide synthase [Cycloclasticus sp. symbiont of Poecilosclerida sp. M]|nr:MAG: lipid-A-disaccharide synthase [Cycloclasticus sp. symbiont of Poecilosclerida sp. M]